jgi:hypothetical protein
LIFTVSLLSGCGAPPVNSGYRAIALSERADPLAPRKDFPAWKAPRQFAIFIHPHEDRERRTMVGGHWMMILLSEGSWYTVDEVEHEPVPDAEASKEDIRAGLSSLAAPGDAVVPYRVKKD